jgi:hypothetical protein
MRHKQQKAQTNILTPTHTHTNTHTPSNQPLGQAWFLKEVGDARDAEGQNLIWTSSTFLSYPSYVSPKSNTVYPCMKIEQ